MRDISILWAKEICLVICNFAYSLQQWSHQEFSTCCKSLDFVQCMCYLNVRFHSLVCYPCKHLPLRDSILQSLASLHHHSHHVSCDESGNWGYLLRLIWSFRCFEWLLAPDSWFFWNLWHFEWVVAADASFCFHMCMRWCFAGAWWWVSIRSYQRVCVYDWSHRSLKMSHYCYYHSYDGSL